MVYKPTFTSLGGPILYSVNHIEITFVIKSWVEPFELPIAMPRAVQLNLNASSGFKVPWC